VEEADWENLSEQGFTNLDINLETSENGFQVLIRGKAVDSELRTPEVTDRVSFVASLPASRQSILGLQRKAGEDGGLVADGRDMGTVVFPHAELKIYLIADLEERAMRRLREMGENSPDDLGLAQQARALDTRDQSDSQRTISPLKKAEDAIELDTTELAFEEQVQAIADLAHRLTLL
jgi:cytidylate kinase|tara:strand:- start:17 stop:550 length:534 start_codon:yes stop_codon:yes gene_type:complete